MLLSSGSPTKAPHTVYLADRGGRDRLGQFTQLTTLQWDRRLDDISQARITLADAAVAANREILDRVAVSRHELVIYRGDERVWEGPITLDQRTQNTVTIEAKDPMWYTNRTVVHNGYSNAYPNLVFVVDRVNVMLSTELARKEALDPPINVLPYVHTYSQAGDARTTRVTLPYSMQLWDHIDDLAATAGMDYTTVGRAMHFWDSTRAALGRTRDVTNDDFSGQATITDYGVETATRAISADSAGNYGIAGGIDPFYGEIEFYAPAYGETGNSVTDPSSPDVGDPVAQAELNAQAIRNLHGRIPTPRQVAIPSNSSFRVSEGGLGFDVLVPGVHMPLRVTVANRTYAHIQKLHQVTVSVSASGGEQIQVSLAPTDDSDFLDEGLVVTEGGDA